MSAYRDSGMRATVSLDQQTEVEYEKVPFLRDLLPLEVKSRMDNAPRQSPSELMELYDHLIETWHGAAQGRLRAAMSCSAPQRVSLQSRHGMRNAHLVRAIGMMEESIEEPRSPSCIAESLRISTRQLERLFGRYLNSTPKHYFMELRLHRARNLLVQTDQSITEIAMACGFRSTSHFTKTFRAFYGRTPLSQRTTLN